MDFKMSKVMQKACIVTYSIVNSILCFIFQVLPGLYVGNYRDSKDPQQLDRHNITHIVAIHDCPRRLLQVS